ncbi:MAG: hypothetical protein JWL90_4746 [Chthoniobacteraceae bacterium]|nr:hypothetical protein [Chthoniobacteraceae bacterium]
MRYVLPVMLLTLLASPVSAQRRRPTVRISLNVSADGSMNSTITSYLGREFRKLDDVIITDDKPLYRISCVAMRNRNQGGYFTGYTL